MGHLAQSPGVGGLAADDTWLLQRMRHTHDLWHVVSGCPPTVAGEAALRAINVMELRWPGSAMLLGTDLLHRCLEGPTPGEPGEPDVGEAVAYGLELEPLAGRAGLEALQGKSGWSL